MGRITGVPPDMGEMALNAEVGEAVLGALKPMLIAEGKARFVAAGCSRGGKQALRFALLSDHLHAVLAVDAGTLEDTVDCCSTSAARAWNGCAIPIAGAVGAAGPVARVDGVAAGPALEGDVDSMVAGVVLRGIEVHVRSGGMRGYASYARSRSGSRARAACRPST